MYAVGRIGNYISRGVYTVSGPFHPFGGAVDIIVVEQPDGSFKSSPWYVRFGKFQGVLKTKEKIVNISVNGAGADFHMYLDHKGEAYFLRQVDEKGEEESVSYPSSSSDETDVQCDSTGRLMKSKTCSYDVNESNSTDQFDVSDGAIVARTNLRQPRILGLVFGQRSMKEDSYREGEDDAGVVRISSLERAEIAADLLEVQWSTNLATSRYKKDHSSRFSSPKMLDSMADKGFQNNSEQSQVGSSMHDDVENSNDQCVLQDTTDFSNEQAVNSSQSVPEIVDCSYEKANRETPSKNTLVQVVETSAMSEKVLEEKCEVLSVVSKDIDECINASADQNDNAKGVISEIRASDSQILCYHEVCPTGEPFDAEEVCSERVNDKSRSDRVQAFVYCETSESSIVGLDGSSAQACETLYFAGGGSGKVRVFAETLHATGKLQCEDVVVKQAGDTESEIINVEVSKSCSQQTNLFPSCTRDDKKVDLEEPVVESVSHAHMVSVDPAVSTAEEESQSSGAIFTDIGLQVKAEQNDRNDLQPSSLHSVGNSQSVCGDSVPMKAVSILPSEISEEEQLLFGDLDELKPSKGQSTGSVSPDSADTCYSDSLRSTKELNGSVNVNDILYSQPDNFLQDNGITDLENSIESRVLSSSIDIPSSRVVASGEVGLLGVSLPSMCFHSENLDANGLGRPLSHSLDSNLESSKWMFLSEDESSCKMSVAKRGTQLLMEQGNNEDSQISEKLEGTAPNPPVGDASKAIVSSSGNWTIWPFSFKRSRSRKAMPPASSDARSADVKNASESNNGKGGGKYTPQPKVAKKMVRLKTPTSEQLASLNLKEGRNTITFKFSTAMLGDQGVDARVYLWKWNTRIVISDVDGTITKSDVLGQFMPLVGMDWSQTGVAHLFSAIKENGYQLLFLSARSISQAYHTRQFLVNLKQDGKALPDGPVVISPDGLFPSLYREVIRRAPHEFKIACLEDIKALFPPDCNPFYAGFGNRDTDEISYLKVGIPKGKIFIINPRGEVAVNRRVDTKSYRALHALVHGMFPARTSSEQEDFNSWNYWKLPPPLVDI